MTFDIIPGSSYVTNSRRNMRYEDRRGTGRCGGGRYGGGHYGGGRYGGGRYGGAFLKGVDATAEPPDTHFTMDATAEIRRFPCSIAVKA